MRKLILAMFIASFVVAVLVFYVRPNSRSARPAAISSITFQEVDRMVQSTSSDGEVQACSRGLHGTRVRWSGTVTSIDEDRTVYLATDQFPTNVQFDLSKEVTSGLREGERVRFVGTVEKVLDAETAPPMFHTYVVLRDVELEKSEK